MDSLSKKGGLIGLLFQSTITSAESEPEGIRLFRKSHDSVLVTWGKLLAPPILKQGLFFSSVMIPSEQERYEIKWANHTDASDFRKKVLLCFYKHHEATVNKALSQIKDQTDRIHYLRTSYCLKISEYAQTVLNKVQVPPEDLYDELPENLLDSFVLLYKWSSLHPEFLEAQRQSYVEQQKEANRELFDRIESNPLTDKQRDACIIDEDNNLVLAGAGTGKTSTMIGRVGYLINSHQASAKEILMLAFGNKAAEEMRERITEKLGIEHITARTFHSLGQSIIAAVEKKKPAISPLATDEKLLSKTVDTWFTELLKDPDYQTKTIRYFEKFLYPAANPFEFNSEGEYIEFIRANEIRTLKGENVKSLEECYIANWLFRMGVEYEYEASYKEADTRTPEFRQYYPDFYLSEHGIYIEHFGIDRDGNTAPYIDKTSYNEGIAWKRELHNANKTKLVETFHYDQREGALLPRLEAQLIAQGVNFDPLPQEAVLNTLEEFGVISTFAGILSKLLQRYKANCYHLESFEAIIESHDKSALLKAAFELLKPLFERYQRLLNQHQEIDFDDMIAKAIVYVQEGLFISPWKFILVDEFQDISEPRARLVTALRDAKKNSSVFCVGDDWQAIYRFTGSDVSLTTGFERLFGATKTTALDKTFRFNNSISDIASRFITQNPAQVKKQIATVKQTSTPAVLLVRKDISADNTVKHVQEILEAISDISSEPKTVYLLARFHFKLLEQHQLKECSNLFPNLIIEQLSFHGSKGKEADYVIVLGLERGKHGFPSRKVTHPLLDALLPQLEEFPDAEERRLFYVALTRAKDRSYLLTDMTNTSDFVKELINDSYPIGTGVFDVSSTQATALERHCPSCETGTVVKRTGPYGVFLSCNNYPLCSYKDKVCPVCQSEMKTEGRFKMCINDQCQKWVPICPSCKGELRLRDGRNGQFWGCINYRRSGQSCSHTENHIEPPVKHTFQATSLQQPAEL
ncbi:helicase IV [Amphritea opalescens]|uniref:DNA 3'-5' helicase n=1 Tax=Amphritea opalescens TaxID=2490544 RepID=A0A430KN59_9GAMM|nr:UvrD-helicase domain-containing protein [Amphritea opalescens]RTE64929.1 helicase IV [Amphritea opalescens]